MPQGTGSTVLPSSVPYVLLRGSPSSSSSQTLMDAQNSRIEELLQKIKQQQYKLDKQNLQIKSLQSKVSTRPALHAAAVRLGTAAGS